MKKTFSFAITALAVLAIASCTREATEPESDSAPVNVCIAFDDSKASLGDDDGFSFNAGDVINWNSASGDASQTLEAAAKIPVLTIEIPGLASSDVTGFFSCNCSENIDFAAIASCSAAGTFDGLYLAGDRVTIAKGTSDISVGVGFVGGVIELFPYSATYTAEKVRRVSVSSESNFTGVATYDAATRHCSLTATAAEAVTSLGSAYAVPSDKGCGICIAVPDVTIVKPVYTVVTDKAIYTFASGTDKEIKAGYKYDIKLNLDKATSRAELVPISGSDISSNDPMQYKVGGSDVYGFDSNPDWFAAITPAQKAAREAKFGLGDNLFDGDPATCYHTNMDWGEPNTSWGTRSMLDRYTLRYIQASFPAVYNGVSVSFRNSDAGKLAGGYQIQVSADGEVFENSGSSFGPGEFGSEFKLDLSGSIQGIRIVNTKSDADWTCIQSAFGIAELQVVATGGSDPIEATVTLDKPTLALTVGSSSTLVATVHPASAPDKSVTWTSDNSGVATVVNGLVTGVAAGTTTIKATCAGGASASCTVTVTVPVSGEVLVDLSTATISTNAPMQYKSQGAGADDCGMGGNPDWFTAISSGQKTAREAKYGQVSNLYDGNSATSFHTNTDYGTPNTSWGCRGAEVNFGMHHIDVKLPVSAKKFRIEVTESDCAEYYGKMDESGFKVYLKPNGGNFVEEGTYKYGASTTLTINDVALSSEQFCTIIRFERVGNPDWTYCGQSFGFAEMKIWTIGQTGKAEDEGGEDDPDDPIDVPIHTVVPVTAPSTPAGYTLVNLSQCKITTNNPMQYKTFGYTCDGTWTGSNAVITDEQKTYRKGMYDNLRNLYDNDKATSFHTNFDIYETGSSWAQRAGATTPLNYIQVELPSNVHQFCIWTVNPINGAYWGYTTVGDHTHAYGEINVSKDGNSWSCTDAGECLYLTGSTDGSEFYFGDMTCSSFDSIKYIKIQPHVGETSSGTFGNMAGFFGLSELRIWVK